MRKTLEPQARSASTRFKNRLRSEACPRTHRRSRPRAVAERALRRNPRPTGHPGVLPRDAPDPLPKHRFRGTSARVQNAPRPIEQSLSLLRRCSTAFRPRCLGYQPSALVLGTGVEPATARPKSGALPTELTEIGDGRFEPMSGTHGADPRSARRGLGRPVRRWTDGTNGANLQRDAGGSRTHSKPLCRRPPSHLAPTSIAFRPDKKCPRQDSNLILDLRRVACDPPHSEDVAELS
jgi:hypothetical protein